MIALGVGLGKTEKAWRWRRGLIYLAKSSKEVLHACKEVLYACNPSTWELDAGGELSVLRTARTTQCQLTYSYIGRLCLRKPNE